MNLKLQTYLKLSRQNQNFPAKSNSKISNKSSRQIERELFSSSSDDEGSDNPDKPDKPDKLEESKKSGPSLKDPDPMLVLLKEEMCAKSVELLNYLDLHYKELLDDSRKKHKNRVKKSSASPNSHRSSPNNPEEPDVHTW